MVCFVIRVVVIDLDIELQTKGKCDVHDINTSNVWQKKQNIKTPEIEHIFSTDMIQI